MIRERFQTARLAPRALPALWAGAILLYLLVTALQSSRRLWHDELYTLYIASAPSLARLFRELPLDLNPPLEYLTARASLAAFGNSEYALRLPSVLAFLAGSIALGIFAARQLKAPAYGLLAMLAFWATPYFSYATEARPYALVVAFLALAMLAWQNAGRGPWAIWLLGFAVCGMMLSHLLAALYILPLCAAEAFRCWRLRRINWAIWVALLLPCVIPFLFLRMVARVESSAFPAAFAASLPKIAEAYYASLKLAALPLLVALGSGLLVSRAGGQPEGERIQLTLDARVLTGGLLAMPIAVNLALMHSHAAFFDRYAMPVALGYALAFCYLLADRGGRSQRAALASAAVLGLYFLAFNVGPGRRESFWTRRAGTSAAAGLTGVEAMRPDVPLVAASGLTFVELDHYGSEQTVKRLFYLTDRERAVRYANATIFEGLPDAKAAFPIRSAVMPFSEFIRRHPTFLVLGTPDYPEDWLLRYLLDSRATLQYLGYLPGPYKDHELFLVNVGKQ